MVQIRRAEINEFRLKGKTILKIEKVRYNPIRKWYKQRNPMISGFNYFIILFCRIFPPCGFKNMLYRLIGVKIGKRVAIGNDCILDIFHPELTRLEDDVSIGWGVRLFTHEFTQDTAKVGTINLKKNCMIGASSSIRPGIEIGENSVIAAMSFVNKDVPKDVVAGGVPVKVLKKK